MAARCAMRRVAQQLLRGKGAAQIVPVSSPLHTAPRFAVAVPHSELFPGPPIWSGVRRMSSDMSTIPELADPQAKAALNMLLATNWSHIETHVADAVEAAIPKSGGDDGVLATVWSSARACEIFSEVLVSLRMDLDELSGADGETVKKVPDELLNALESAFTKYVTYLEGMNEDEEFLKKKVENDVGSILAQMKQRCSGLDSKWGSISLLGTSGISGSYIEKRAPPV